MLLALDIGTSSTRAAVFSNDCQLLSSYSRPIDLFTPKANWVEQDAEQLLQETLVCAREALAEHPSITALGITNQRETVIAWDKQTGKALYPAIVWKDSRTLAWCDENREQYQGKNLQAITGTPLDPYFSATKMHWLLHNVDAVQNALTENRLAMGTVDSYLIWHLTQGSAHLTDTTNASRTGLMDCQSGQWSDDCLAFYAIPSSTLPQIRPSCGVMGAATIDSTCPPIPISGVIGDQQSALLGQGCTEPGSIKCTYGTGTFMLMHTGTDFLPNQNGLIASVACASADITSYCLEGGAFCAGSMLDWLQNTLNLFQSANEIDTLLEDCDSTHGVVVIPAFQGLGAPHWRRDARAQISGLSLMSTKSDILAAAMQSIAHQTQDIIRQMQQTTDHTLKHLKIDGGIAKSRWFCQRLSDITGLTIHCPENQGSITALGAALTAKHGIEEPANKTSADNTASNALSYSVFNPIKDEQWRRDQSKNWLKCIATLP